MLQVQKPSILHEERLPQLKEIKFELCKLKRWRIMKIEKPLGRRA